MCGKMHFGAEEEVNGRWLVSKFALHFSTISIIASIKA
jgi:hypothetical protein